MNPRIRGSACITHIHALTEEPGYNDIGLRDTSPITSDILWYQLIPIVNRNILLVGYNDTEFSVPAMTL